MGGESAFVVSNFYFCPIARVGINVLPNAYKTFDRGKYRCACRAWH